MCAISNQILERLFRLDCGQERAEGELHSHASNFEILSVISKHVPCQHHPGGPCLPAAAGGEVLMDLEWRGEQAAKVQGGIAGWFVLGEGREVLIEGERVKAWRRGW